MSDMLLEVTRRPAARGLIKSLGLPIPLPEPLARAKEPWSARPLEGAVVIAGVCGPTTLVTPIATALAEAGASPYVDETHAPGIVEAFASASEAYARPVHADGAVPSEARIDALVFDASGATDVAGLRALYEFFQARLDRLKRSGRVVVLGLTPQAAAGVSPSRAAAQAALSGFVRSIAKEIGKKGATANLVLVEPGAEARVPAVLRWVLDRRSAFVTAQPFVVSNRANEGRPAAWVRPLDGQVALVTGAARGIGRATARALAREGAHVLCADRPEDADETSRLARDIGGVPVSVDVTAADAASRIADAAGARGIDVLVHNAGITRDKTLARMKPEQWDAVLAVNLDAVLRITDALERRTLRDGGRIVCLSSVSGIAGNLGQTNYAASKAALIGWVDAASERLSGRGITANAIAPGFIETRMTASIPLAIREAGRRLSALAQGGLPEDVAEAITFLASPGAQGISGRTLRVCGGALIGA